MPCVPLSTCRPASAIVEIALCTAMPTNTQTPVHTTMATSLNSWAASRPGDRGQGVIQERGPVSLGGGAAGAGGVYPGLPPQGVQVGRAGFGPPDNLRADHFSVKGVNLPYAKFPRNPETF